LEAMDSGKPRRNYTDGSFYITASKTPRVYGLLICGTQPITNHDASWSTGYIIDSPLCPYGVLGVGFVPSI